VGWEVLDEYADAHAICSDSISAEGMRILAKSKGDDQIIVSGESGAVGIGMLVELMKNPKLKDVRDKLRLDKNSIVLCFNTEGDTDPENYYKIVHEGAYPNIR
jgi:diaminopropionate ammonia-lyase